MSWVADNLPTIIIGSLLLIAFCLAVRSIVRTHKKGGCCGGCTGCPHAGNCHHQE